MTKFTSADPESDVTNNTFASPITITKPDLTPTALVTPSSANATQTISISWTVENVGTGAATNGYRSRFWFSTNDVLGGDTDLGFNDFTGSLASGDSRTSSRTVSLPNVAEGPYYLIVSVAKFGSGAESDVTNNELAVPITVTKPDLNPTVLTLPASANSAQNISISWTVQSMGTGTAIAPWRDRIWFSTDATIGGDTSLLFVDKGSGFTLAPGNSYSTTQTVTIPSVAEGTYYLIIETDQAGQPSESDETNNGLAMPITVTKPDLTPTVLTAPGIASPVQSISISWTVQDVGTGTAFPPWRDRIWFSTDAAVGGDTSLTFVDKGSGFTLAPSNTYATTRSVTIPNVAAGTYYLIIETDNAGQLQESNETNNALATAIQVTTCGDGVVFQN